MMSRLARLLRKSPADRRLLARAAAVHLLAAIAVRVLPFGRVQRLLAALGAPARGLAPVDAGRIVQAVHTVSASLPGGNCLTDALTAQCLLARHQRDTTLCFGVARVAADGRPFDAHAWLEDRGTGIIGGRSIVYDPLRHPSRCVPSPSSR